MEDVYTVKWRRWAWLSGSKFPLSYGQRGVTGSKLHLVIKGYQSFTVKCKFEKSNNSTSNVDCIITHNMCIKNIKKMILYILFSQNIVQTCTRKRCLPQSTAGLVVVSSTGRGWNLLMELPSLAAASSLTSDLVPGGT